MSDLCQLTAFFVSDRDRTVLVIYDSVLCLCLVTVSVSLSVMYTRVLCKLIC